VQESEHTRHAITHYRVVESNGRFSLVELTLITGRRHQIRVQMKEAGCPVIGDEKYGAKTNPAGRLGLHSCFLSVTHPRTGARLTLQSPLPPVLAAVMKR
jgi:23S rRNA pseudouridine1911/1915/1917 synthase